MREIKFRAWDGSQMRSSFVIHQANGMVMVDKGDQNLQFKPDWVVMQFTGLQDKNGKDIYEGDIIKGRLGKRNFIVRYIVDGWCLDAGETPRLHNYIHETGEVEVIGNIHENPEACHE